MSRALHPALVRLLWLKLRGRARVLARRLRTVRGLVFGGLGLGLFGLWVFALVLRLRTGGAAPDPDVVRPLAQLAVVGYAGFAITANLSWRGLYLPRAELERLFSAPVPRAHLVRYRLLGTLAPTSFVALLVGVITAARVPTPWAGFCAGALVVWTTSVVGQGAALLAAREDGACARLLGRLPGGVPRVVGALGLAGVLLLLMFADGLAPQPESTMTVDGATVTVTEYGPPRGPLAGDVGARLDEFARHPVARVVAAPGYPYAAAAAAPSVGAAAPWLLACAVLFALLFECVARMPVDFREASLSTSRDVERRLSRLRRGQFGAAASDARRGPAGRVPWLLGRGPLGAVVWAKSAALLRQGRGALAVGVVMTAFGVFVGVTLLPPDGTGAAALALLGIAYLSSGLRFDFRADLDRLESLRAWPLAAWQVFLGGVLPVTCVVSLFVGAMLLLRGAVLGSLDGDALRALALTPLGALLWIALDNALFLLFPVRFVPGQGGALQHSGRALVMVVLRLGLLAAVGGTAALAAVAATWVGVQLELGPAVLAGLGVSAAILVLAGAGVLLVAFGGWALGRFDPARARLTAG